MPYYRKKPLVIEAEQFHIDDPHGPLSEKFRRAVCACPDRGTWHIHTLEGPHDLTDLDYIACGIKGEFYPVKNRIFQATYDPAGPQS